jgi:integrase/recombinase XerC
MAPLPNIVERYHTHLRDVGKSPHTVKAYVGDVQRFAKWWEQTSGDSFGPALVDSRDVQDYRGSLIQKQLKPATINRRLKAVQHFFKWASRTHQAHFNPFDILAQVYLKEQRNTAPQWLSRQEQLALLRAVRKAENLRDLAIVQTLLGSGLRVSELTALTLADVDLAERKGSVRVRSGKGMKARTIPLDQRTRQALAAYLAQRPDQPSHLFLGQRGPLTDRAIEKLVEKYAYQAQLAHCTPHTLRHTYAKNLLDSAEKPGLEIVATLLGHASLETTRIYTLPSEKDLERAVRSAAGEL